MAMLLVRLDADGLSTAPRFFFLPKPVASSRHLEVGELSAPLIPL